MQIDKYIVKVIPKWMTAKQAKIAAGLFVITMYAAIGYVIFLTVRHFIRQYKEKKQSSLSNV
jgi:hypothetical protein